MFCSRKWATIVNSEQNSVWYRQPKAMVVLFWARVRSIMVYDPVLIYKKRQVIRHYMVLNFLMKVFLVIFVLVIIIPTGLPFYYISFLAVILATFDIVLSVTSARRGLVLGVKEGLIINLPFLLLTPLSIIVLLFFGNGGFFMLSAFFVLPIAVVSISVYSIAVVSYWIVNSLSKNRKYKERLADKTKHP
jgi:hypothetical protein